MRDPPSNLSTLQRFNDSTLQRFNDSTLQRFNEPQTTNHEPRTTNTHCPSQTRPISLVPVKNPEPELRFWSTAPRKESDLPVAGLTTEPLNNPEETARVTFILLLLVLLMRLFALNVARLVMDSD